MDRRESNREDIEDQNRRHGRRPYTDAKEEMGREEMVAQGRSPWPT